jgi:hypothetical protein
MGPSSDAETMNAHNVHIVTSCYGPRYWLAVDKWTKHIRSFETWPIDIVSVDGERYVDTSDSITTVCVNPPDAELAWGSGDKYRTERVLAHLKGGLTCFQIDLDVQLKRGISILLDLPYDFLISRAFRCPPLAREKLGFVACTGFYLAKPGAARLCATVLRHIACNTYGSFLDQVVLNNMLVEAAEHGGWRRRSLIFGELGFDVDEFECCGCKIAVLPKAAILRSADRQTALFGNHDSSLLEHFFPKPMVLMDPVL